MHSQLPLSCLHMMTLIISVLNTESALYCLSLLLQAATADGLTFQILMGKSHMR